MGFSMNDKEKLSHSDITKAKIKVKSAFTPLFASGIKVESPHLKKT